MHSHIIYLFKYTIYTVPVTSYLRFFAELPSRLPQNAARQNMDFLQPTADRSKLREDFRSVDRIIPCRL